MDNGTTERNTVPDDLEQAVHDLADVGKVWAQHGLRVGQSALETSAWTLRTTASLLGRLSDHFEARSKERDEDVEPEGDEATEE